MRTKQTPFIYILTLLDISDLPDLFHTLNCSAESVFPVYNVMILYCFTGFGWALWNQVWEDSPYMQFGRFCRSLRTQASRVMRFTLNIVCLCVFLDHLSAIVVSWPSQSWDRKRNSKTLLPRSVLQSFCVCWGWRKSFHSVI